MLVVHGSLGADMAVEYALTLADSVLDAYVLRLVNTLVIP
jgi:hypothetical protein